ncbi:MAG: MarR family transcriptional regulator [Euzebyaceae bacterium]|nr:MarR family transcriptional regulator [Euzebyaceae bacterium]
MAHRRMRDDLTRLVDARAFPELRGSHLRLLSLIPSAGARPTELAETVQVTKQALGQLVQYLAEHGYVELADDPTDGRAVVVRRTERGRDAALVAARGIRALEQAWATEVGGDRFEVLQEALAALVEGGDQPGAA